VSVQCLGHLEHLSPRAYHSVGFGEYQFGLLYHLLFNQTLLFPSSLIYLGQENITFTIVVVEKMTEKVLLVFFNTDFDITYLVPVNFYISIFVYIAISSCVYKEMYSFFAYTTTYNMHGTYKATTLFKTIGIKIL